MTINECLVLQKAIRGRLNSLRSLRDHCSIKETFFRDTKTIKEPLYEAKKLDKKIVELEAFLFRSEALIKKSNAITEIEIEFDLEKLLESIE